MHKSEDVLAPKFTQRVLIIFVFLYLTQTHVFANTNTHTVKIRKLFHTNQMVPSSDYSLFQVSTSEELYRVVNNAGDKKTAIFLNDGTYQLNRTLVIKSPHLMLLSMSGNPYKVVLKGKGTKATASVDNLIYIASTSVVLDGLTLTDSPNHLIQFAGEAGANAPIVRNSILQNAYEQLIKVTGTGANSVNHGVVEHCIFQFTQGEGFNYYTGGIDAHAAVGWKVIDSVFKDIASPGKQISQYAVHFWNQSADNIVEGNLFMNNDRSIGFGMRLERGDANSSNSGGLIRNNVIVHSNTIRKFSDTAIMLEASPNSQVVDNWVYHEHRYPNAIEVRFAISENVLVHHNYTNKRIVSRNGASVSPSANKRINNAQFVVKLGETLERLQLTMITNPISN